MVMAVLILAEVSAADTLILDDRVRQPKTAFSRPESPAEAICARRDDVLYIACVSTVGDEARSCRIFGR
jgi:hypothetical protein